MPTGRTPIRFEPADPDFLHDPYPTYARLREEAPVLWHEPWDAWVLTRYRDVDRLLRDRRLGRVMEGVEKRPPDPAHAPFDRIQAGSLLEIEPPDHTRIKQVVHDVFTPRHVRALAERIEALCVRQADALAERIESEGEADLITVFAEPIPVTVIAELLGVPEADRHQLLPWSKDIIGMFEPERTPEGEAAAVRAADAFARYLRELVAIKRRAPDEDLITRMTRVHDADPAQLSEDELVANGILFLNAGHEAVVNVLGNGMRALLAHEDQLARVRADDGLVPTAVEEMMRYDTPLQFFERFVTEPMRFEADDGTVHDWPAGTKLALYYASANRDPAVFSDPERFDVGRDPNPHLAFGLGIHYCIGAPLARLELRHAVGALLDRFPSLRIAQDELSYVPKNVFRYLTELRVAT
jgi:unspecific monooxygenase